MTKITKKEPLHHVHFILDAKLKTPLKINNKIVITKKIINSLMENLKMYPLGALEIYDATDPNYPGWSFIQPITTSHISGHYFYEENEKSHIHIDVYSCKIFDWQLIIDILEDNMIFDEWKADIIFRDTSKKRSIKSISSKTNS